jgi:hypothetical protein
LYLLLPAVKEPAFVEVGVDRFRCLGHGCFPPSCGVCTEALNR